jgi:signal transduction histidine kinase
MTVARYEPDATATVLADCSKPALRIPVGTRLTLEGDSVTGAVLRTGRLIRRDTWEGTTGSMAALAQEMGLRLAIGVPIIVEGRVWGSMSAGWTRAELPLAEMEGRMAQFTELVDTAIANADSRAELTASRARVLAAGDDARRRVVRDLHDGAQQRLVHTIVTLELAARALAENDATVESLIAEALAQAEEANAELRELAHGILPSVLTRGGLRAGVDALVSRNDVPVNVDVVGERFPPGIEASAYFVVAEALTNVVKHSRAQRADVRAWVDAGALHVEIRDDGVGGAAEDGAGLVGLGDRVHALGGRFRVESPPGDGTLVAAVLALPV